MNIFVVDHEKLLRSFKTYTDGIEGLNKLRDDHISFMSEKQKELETIVNSSQTLIFDESQKRDLETRFNNVQQEMVKADDDMREKIIEARKKVADDSSRELNDLINEFSKSSDTLNPDIIISKQASLYFNPMLDITSEVIEYMKEGGVYVEFKQNEE